MKLNDANTVAASNGVHKDINKKNNPAFKWAFIIIGAVVVVMLAMFFVRACALWSCLRFQEPVWNRQFGKGKAG